MSEQVALVVDDNLANRRLASILLQKSGWATLEADCGERALEVAAANCVRVVLLDISMPGISGEETCARLRSAYAGRPLAIYAYTAHAFPHERERFLAEGFDEILVKPLDRKRLEALLGNL